MDMDEEIFHEIIFRRNNLFTEWKVSKVGATRDHRAAACGYNPIAPIDQSVWGAMKVGNRAKCCASISNMQRSTPYYKFLFREVFDNR